MSIQKSVIFRVFAILVIAVSGLIISFNVFGNDNDIKLPDPQLDRGRPLMQVLKDRRTVRTFTTEMLSQQELSNLLWAAWGVNRSESGKRTAPSWANWKEVEIYVATAGGLYLYNAQEHKLEFISKKDIRKIIRKYTIREKISRLKSKVTDFITIAPVSFIYVADYSKMKRRMRIISQYDKRFIAGTDIGFISQNVYLYCASEGLATVMFGGIDHNALHKAMKLPSNKHVMYAQPIGYRKK